MKHLYATLPLFLTSLFTYAQCSAVGIQVSSSDTTSIQLYHSGFFNIDSGYANVCTWEVTTFNNTIVHQATTSGAWADQSFTLFNHSVPITDSMHAELVITNGVTGSICTINDILYWHEEEVIPGVFIGNWDILGNNGGIATSTADLGTTRHNLAIYPSPALDHIRIPGDALRYDLAIISANGAVVYTHNNIGAGDRVDISQCTPGIYFMQLWDERHEPLGTRKFIKL